MNKQILVVDDEAAALCAPAFSQEPILVLPV